jgi:anti-sigma regulatory factor (Ser/Thr protein kinase)
MLTDVLVVEGPQAVRHARHHVHDVCEASDLSHLSDLASLLTSELVTNALQHSHGSAQVLASRVGDRLQVVIADDSPAPPRVVARDDMSESGRGMLLVDALSRAWGVDAGSGGKVVWFEV